MPRRLRTSAGSSSWHQQRRRSPLTLQTWPQQQPVQQQQQQVHPPEHAVALDVEYAHFQAAVAAPPAAAADDTGAATAPQQQVSAPAWVALVDCRCRLLLKTHVQPQVPAGARWMGGVRPEAYAHAPDLETLRQQLRAHLGGRLPGSAQPAGGPHQQQPVLLVGHGLSKDLAALGMAGDLQHEPVFDTMLHRPFANRAGSARSLRQLAAAHLGLAIQQQTGGLGGDDDDAAAAGAGAGAASKPSASAPSSRQQHDPEEDAAAVMRLYAEVVWPDSYEGRVAAETVALLAAMRGEQQQQQGERPDGTSG